MIYLVFPKESDEPSVLEYKHEFILNHESIDGSAGLQFSNNYETWLHRVCNNRNQDTAEDGCVQSYTYLVKDNENNSLIGMIDMRQNLNDYLYNFGGHIGYSVRSSQRGRGYATEMLRVALSQYKENKFPRVLLTCSKSNHASKRVIEKNGGIFENEVQCNGISLLRFWIEL